MLHRTTLNPPLPLDLWRKRLRYRSWHRGCKETDLVLGRYCDTHLETLDEAAMTLFETFLDEDDADIWSWLTGKTPCPKTQYAALLEQMRKESAGA